MRSVKLPSLLIGPHHPLCLIAGPCVIESAASARQIAEELKEICCAQGLNFIFKASFDKANRSSGDSYRGPGLEEGLAILGEIKSALDLAITTDIHAPDQADRAARVCDLLQIPAFLCRQTDLLRAAGKTGRPVNVKKGPFVAPWDMQNVVAKIGATGNHQVMLTERGTCFGYNSLVNDMRSLPIMRALANAVCYDATHSAQSPGGLGARSGGRREHIPALARASVAAGCDALFLETHSQPHLAKCDSSTSWPLAELPALLAQCRELHALVQCFASSQASSETSL